MEIKDTFVRKWSEKCKLFMLIFMSLQIFLVLKVLKMSFNNDLGWGDRDAYFISIFRQKEVIKTLL